MHYDNIASCNTVCFSNMCLSQDVEGRKLQRGVQTAAVNRTYPYGGPSLRNKVLEYTLAKRNPMYVELIYSI
jgi:hypothetical protein